MGHPLPTTKCGKCDRRIVWRKSAKMGADLPLVALIENAIEVARCS